MGLLQDLENAVGFHGSDSDSYHDSGLDGIVHGIAHGVHNIAPAAITLGILGAGLKIITGGIRGGTKKR